MLFENGNNLYEHWKLEGIKTSWRRLEDVFAERIANTSWRCVEDVLKTRSCYAEDVLKAIWKRLGNQEMLVLLKQQINFIGKLEKDNGATMFFIIEKSKETFF